MMKVQKDEKETNDKTKKNIAVIHKIRNWTYGSDSNRFKYNENISFWSI